MMYCTIFGATISSIVPPTMAITGIIVPHTWDNQILPRRYGRKGEEFFVLHVADCCIAVFLVKLSETGTGGVLWQKIKNLVDLESSLPRCG